MKIMCLSLSCDRQCVNKFNEAQNVWTRQWINCNKLHHNQMWIYIAYKCVRNLILEQLRSEIPPPPPPLLPPPPPPPQDKVTVTNFEKLPKIQILKFCKKLYTRHTFWSCLVRCINMKWIQPEPGCRMDGRSETNIPPNFGIISNEQTDGNRNNRWEATMPLASIWCSMGKHT